ncbi:MAG: hypothetical protein BBJ57_04825 [Desulfobacterales bacterium PC51MH44]|nr:MAG: hypothetical protein BBJ57_04825 [Desulfobacterales bacterium PC51MH44]
MKKQLIFTFTFVFLLLIPFLGFCDEWQDLVEHKAKGSINWSKGVIQAKGIGAPPEKLNGNPNARSTALKAAKLDAYRKILEVIKKVRIDGNTLVGDYAAENDIIMSKIESMVQSAEVVKKEYLSDGTVEITMNMNLHGGFSQLVLPEDIRSLESIKPVTPAGNSSSFYTGMVVDARGLKAMPVMSPKILDENSQEVYGPAFVSREYAVQRGLNGYAKNLAAAQSNQRVSDNPLTVKGLRTEGTGRCNIVISNADASKLRGASENLIFMKKCRVMIVVE